MIDGHDRQMVNNVKERDLVGEVLFLDTWSSSGALIITADDIDKKFLGAQYRIETGKPLIMSLPIKVEITGRKIVWRQHNWFVRVKIEFVTEHDDYISGYDNTVGGWLLANFVYGR